MPTSPAMFCWDSPTTLVALPRNPARYVRLAQALIDAVPCTWNRMLTHLVIEADGSSRCEVRATCGDRALPGIDCISDTRRALAELAHASLVPERSVWVGIWIDYDIEGDSLTATIVHGGTKACRDHLVPSDYQHDDVVDRVPFLL